MTTISRYFRLYGYFLRFSFSKAMEFRMDFYFRVVMDVLYYAVNILFFKLLFLHTGMLGGWSESQMMIFVAGYLVVDAINMTLFSNNLWMFPLLVNKGDLDYYLVRPVSSLFFLTLRDFAASSFVNLLMTAAIMIWALASYPDPLNPSRVAMFLLFILNGTLIYFCVRMYFVLPVFWTHSARGFDQVFWSIGHFMERPDRIFTGWIRRILIYVLPFSLMASFPARVLFEGPTWSLVGPMVLMSVVLFSALLLYWRLALRSYSSASS